MKRMNEMSPYKVDRITLRNGVRGHQKPVELEFYPGTMVIHRGVGPSLFLQPHLRHGEEDEDGNWNVRLNDKRRSVAPITELALQVTMACPINDLKVHPEFRKLARMILADELEGRG